jgi:hypothetical protein
MAERPDSSAASFTDAEGASFQEEAEASVRRRGGEAPKEPSARARLVSARLDALDEQAAAAAKTRRSRLRPRRGKAEPDQWQPEGWRTGPAWQEMRGGGRRRRTGRLVLAVALVAVVFLGAGALAQGRGWSGLTGLTGFTDSASDAPPLPAETTAPAAAPPATGPDTPTAEHPFAGSPARRWADGAAGIELPEAKAVNGVSEKAVAEDLRLTRRFLVAANLDRDVLAGGSPKEALALLDPAGEENLARVRRSLEKPAEDLTPLNLFTRFDTDDVRLVGDTVKVRGRIGLRAGDERGQAEIHADYTFVYPVTRADDPGDEVTRTIVRRTLTFGVADPERWISTPGKLGLVEMRVDTANGGCRERGDGLLHPWFLRERRDHHPSGEVRDPYDRSRPIAGGGAPDECGTATRV